MKEDVIHGIVIRCYDTGGETRYMPLWRYHVVMVNRRVPRFYPNGESRLFNLGLQFNEKGELHKSPYDFYTLGAHLGRRVEFKKLPVLIQDLVIPVLIREAR